MLAARPGSLGRQAVRLFGRNALHAIICYAVRHPRKIAMSFRPDLGDLAGGTLAAAARMCIGSGRAGRDEFRDAPTAFSSAVLAIAIFIDWKNDRLRWPFPFAFVWFAIAYAILFPGASSQWFGALAKAIGATA